MGTRPVLTFTHDAHPGVSNGGANWELIKKTPHLLPEPGCPNGIPGFPLPDWFVLERFIQISQDGGNAATNILLALLTRQPLSKLHEVH